MASVDPAARVVLDIVDAWADELGALSDLDVLREIVRRERWLAGPIEAVHRVEDVEIPTGSGGVPARLYSTTSPVGVCVFAHGGGWAVGSVEDVDAFCRRLCNASDACVVSVDYRLAPEHPFPAALEDVHAACRWAHDHADELAGSPAVAVAGDSAGANLAAAVALLAQPAADPPLAAQLLVYPPLDPACDTRSYRELDTDYGLTTDAMRMLWELYLGDAAPQGLAAPLLAESLAGLPPAIIVAAELDPLRDDAERYAARLAAAGVPARLDVWPGQIHGFLTYGVIPDGRAATTAAGQALRGLLAG